MKLRNAGGGARKPAPRARAMPPLERKVLALLEKLDALSVYDRELLSEDIGDEHILTHGDMRTGAAATHSLVGFSLARDAMHVKGTPRHAALLSALAHSSPMVSSPSELVYSHVERGTSYYFKVTPAFLQSLMAAMTTRR